MIAELGAGLRALSHPYEIDGRVSWHEPELRGFAPMNCYLITQGDDALLADTGLAIHRDAILGELHDLLPPSARLSVTGLRQGEFDSMCNVAAILEHFDVEAFYGLLSSGQLWGDFQPMPLATLPPRGSWSWRDVPTHPVGFGRTIELGAADERPLKIFFAPLYLTASTWIYDPSTRALLTSDVFSHAVRAVPDGPWSIGSGDPDHVDEDLVLRHLAGTRYWWLRGANTSGLRAKIAAVFEEHPVDLIAPAYGCILAGADVVERHYGMLDRALARLAELPAGVAATSQGA